MLLHLAVVLSVVPISNILSVTLVLLNCNSFSPFKVLAVPDPVISLLSPLAFIVVEVTPVRFDPSIAGNAPVNCAAGIVPVHVMFPVTSRPAPTSKLPTTST